MGDVAVARGKLPREGRAGPHGPCGADLPLSSGVPREHAAGGNVAAERVSAVDEIGGCQ